MALEKISYSFRWKIENYSSCYCKGWDNCLKSPVFTPVNFGGSEWYMKFQPSLRIGEPSQHLVFCYLCRNNVDSGDEEVSVACKIELIGESGNVIYNRGNSDLMRTFKRGKSSGWYAFPCEQINRDSLTWNKDILTIHCQMFTLKEQPNCVARTKIELDRSIFTWEITDCNSHSQNRTFAFQDSSEYLMSVRAPIDSVEIRIQKLKKNSSSPILLKGKISLINRTKEKFLTKTGEHIFKTGDNDEWEFPSFINRKKIKIINGASMNVGSFSLSCEFSVSNGSVSSDILSINDHYSKKLSSIITLHDDLVGMFTSMEHPDVELRTQDVILPSHKALLAARSPVFRAMFNQDMIESGSNVVDILDVHPETLKYFLEFVYTGSVDSIDDESALELLIVADKYQVRSLIETCSRLVLSALSVENICKIMYVADLLSINLLKECAMDFIAKHSTEVFKSGKWLEYIDKNPKMASEILSHLAAGFEFVPKKK